jgi:hypothetical protein
MHPELMAYAQGTSDSPEPDSIDTTGVELPPILTPKIGGELADDILHESEEALSLESSPPLPERSRPMCGRRGSSCGGRRGGNRHGARCRPPSAGGMGSGTPGARRWNVTRARRPQRVRQWQPAKSPWRRQRLWRMRWRRRKRSWRPTHGRMIGCGCSSNKCRGRMAQGRWWMCWRRGWGQS